ncbi:MAG: alpha/beta fold hydrolase, partial [Actinomycetota bacterium]
MNDDGGLAVREEGSGPAVVLVHGWAGSKETWGPFAAALADAGRRTVAVDLPGWGASRAPRRFPHTPVAYAAALAP